jgi:hypothetical protein
LAISTTSPAPPRCAYCGWAPQVKRSGETLDQATLTRGGTHTMKQMLYLVVGNAIQQPDCEWVRLYVRLVPITCSYDERKQRYVGKNKVMTRIAGQIVSTIYALLKRDAELLAQRAPGTQAPAPLLYDPAVHKAHWEGHYHATNPQRSHGIITAFSALVRQNTEIDPKRMRHGEQVTYCSVAI